MPSSTAAVFCTNKNNLENLVKQILERNLSSVAEGKKWFEVIIGNAPTKASEQIWNTIDTILK
jgi:16S rRNA G1207 methylase RsmC